MHSYDPRTAHHKLRHDPIKALVMPRPIGWISTMSAKGIVNLAPYSFFNLVNDNPAQIMFSSMGEKDSLRNIQATGQMVFNGVSESMLTQMNISSGAHTGDEFAIATLQKLPSISVEPPRVAGAPWHLECVADQVIDLKNDGTRRNAMVIATVTHVHIAAEVLNDGMVDQRALNLVARCGYRDYVRAQDFFALQRPDE